MSFDGSKYKAGDTVIVVDRAFRDRITTIDKITPSGRLIVGTSVFNPDGRERGATGYNSCFLLDPTPDRIEQATRNSLITRIDGTVYRRQRKQEGWADLSTDQLRQIAELLRVRPEAKGGER